MQKDGLTFEWQASCGKFFIPEEPIGFDFDFFFGMRQKEKLKLPGF